MQPVIAAILSGPVPNRAPPPGVTGAPSRAPSGLPSEAQSTAPTVVAGEEEFSMVSADIIMVVPVPVIFI